MHRGRSAGDSIIESLRFCFELPSAFPPVLMNSPTAEKPRLLRGIVLVLVTVALFSITDLCSKYLTRFYPVAFVVWACYTFHLVFIVAALGPRLGKGLVRTAHPGVQIVRGFLLVGASLFFVGALKYMPLAESTSIAFLTPLIVTLLSVVFLKEHVDAARWIAVASGFIGVLVIIRPGSDVFHWAVLLPIGNAVAFASYQVLTRKIAAVESAYTSIFYAGLVGSLLLSAALPYIWVTPQSLAHGALLVFVGVLSGSAHLLLIKAYSHAPASRLAPFTYSQLIWVMLIGFVAFGDFPDAWSLAGIALLVASGIYIATHERASARERNAALVSATSGG